MCFSSISKYGQDVWEFEGVHPETLQRYYGVEGEEIICLQRQTGARHPVGLGLDFAGDTSEEEEEVYDDEQEEHDIDNIELPLGIEQDQFRLLRENIAKNLQKNLNHKPVKTP